MTDYYESYIGTSKEEREEMLASINKSDILELFSDIPKELLFDGDMNIPGPFSEAALARYFKNIASKNMDPNKITSFLGGGIRQQYIPAALAEIMSRGELYTAYTPYQPEVSQGMLQIIYEYQSQVAELLDMDIVNASMYDWATAIGEVLLIMARITRKTRFIIAGPIPSNRLEVAKSYMQNENLKIEIIEDKDGALAIEKIISIFEEEATKPKKEQTIAGVYFEVPSFFGTLPEYPKRLVDTVHKSSALVAVGVDPISLGIISPPGEYGADFVVGEGQLLGNSPSTGGPLLGIMALKSDKKWIRQVPGRLIGKTTELTSERPGYCITLQTREQHIRREKATSNICSNQSLTAVNAAIYLATLGKQGVIELAQQLMDKAHYLANELNIIPGVTSPKYEKPFFSEFVVEFKGITHEELEEKCISKNYVPGIKLEGDGCLRLIAVSEILTLEMLDGFVATIKEVML